MAALGLQNSQNSQVLGAPKSFWKIYFLIWPVIVWEKVEAEK